MKVTIEVPEINDKGSELTDADYYKNAAIRLRGDYPVGGSNLRASVATLLERVVEAMSVS